MVGLDDLAGLFQPWCFCENLTFVAINTEALPLPHTALYQGTSFLPHHISPFAQGPQ